MDIKGLSLFIIILLTFLSVGVNCQNQEIYERIPVMPPARRPMPPELSHNNHHNNSWNSGFMQTAKSFVASPLGQFTMSMAKEMVARSAGGNEVLSLNMTSLFILVLLKALIFATGLLGAGNWGQYGRARMMEGQIVDNAEMQIFLGFLAAEGSGGSGCLYRAVCIEPEHGAEYLKAGRALLSGFGVFDPSVTSNPRYNEYLQNIQQAVYEGMQSAPCDMIYSCNI
ncbi:uncharacterized protein [Chironomus tepperi]|uniref:uncharacterized protein isoform X2 n=1 Tax=Chironomus tepperi TaxID=113505 RepID=UPI00391F2B90